MSHCVRPSDAMSVVMDSDWWLDSHIAPIEKFRRRRKTWTMPEQRQRWRMTLDELCYAAKIDVNTFNAWADAGLLGPRLTNRPDSGRGRHITRDTAQRTVLVGRLVAAGVHPEVAGHVAAGHKTGDTTPLSAELPSGITITIPREDLP